MPGPLVGIRVIELAAIGPVPFCAMLLADMGAEVVRVERVEATGGLGEVAAVCGRGRRRIAIDLKTDAGRELLLRLAATADVMIEGNRPGVSERLGVGPEAVAAINPALVYGRMTGWGQDGPMAAMAGHDINYIALSGALHAIGGADPVVPLNLIGDYGGGGLYLTVGVLAALIERHRSGRGQVVDAAMVDGAASLMTPVYQLLAAGLWQDRRGHNLLDGAAPFYRVYRTADDGHVAVGALEPQFYARLLELLEIDAAELPAQLDPSGWPEIESRLAAVFASRPRSYWHDLFVGEDACVTPVLSLEEAPANAHNQARRTFMTRSDHPEPAPAPRFSRTPSIAAEPVAPGRDTAAVLAELQLDAVQIAELVAAGVVGTP